MIAFICTVFSFLLIGFLPIRDGYAQDRPVSCRDHTIVAICSDHARNTFLQVCFDGETRYSFKLKGEDNWYGADPFLRIQDEENTELLFFQGATLEGLLEIQFLKGVVEDDGHEKIRLVSAFAEIQMPGKQKMIDIQECDPYDIGSRRPGNYRFDGWWYHRHKDTFILR